MIKGLPLAPLGCTALTAPATTTGVSLVGCSLAAMEPTAAVGLALVFGVVGVAVILFAMLLGPVAVLLPVSVIFGVATVGLAGLVVADLAGIVTDDVFAAAEIVATVDGFAAVVVDTLLDEAAPVVFAALLVAGVFAAACELLDELDELESVAGAVCVAKFWLAAAVSSKG